jgi:tetratricopeptide (TPR) repeat protein
MRHVLIVLCALTTAAAAQPRPPTTAPPARIDPKRAEMDAMLDALKKAPSEQASAVIEAKLRQAWVNAAGPAAAILIGRGVRNLANNAETDALDDFEAALTLEPDFTEGFARRASAHVALGEYRAALADIQETLKREPRHFGALKILSRLAEQRGDTEGALRAWEKVLEIAPRTAGAAERMIELRQKLEGEGT